MGGGGWSVCEELMDRKTEESVGKQEKIGVISSLAAPKAVAVKQATILIFKTRQVEIRITKSSNFEISF